MTKKMLRSILAVVVVLLTIVVFAAYIARHPEILQALRHTPLPTIGLIFGLYLIFMGTLVWIQRATLDLCDVTLGRKESTLLMMYSSVINFFGPLQSGPAFRAAYLKAKHNVNLKKYTLATLLYYGFYALFSGLLLLSFFVGWWIVPCVIAILLAAPLMVRIPRFKQLNVHKIRNLALASLAQVAVWSIIFYVELHSLQPQVSFLQALAYTGAANFALFVSLTPGAIGFRESFLVFSQELHHIGNATIAAASVLDRSIYIVFLLGLAAFIFGSHANDYLKKQMGNRRPSPKK